jgi:hypothetical protein
MPVLPTNDRCTHPARSQMTDDGRRRTDDGGRKFSIVSLFGIYFEVLRQIQYNEGEV